MATFHGLDIAASARIAGLGDTQMLLDMQTQAAAVLVTSLALCAPAWSAWRASWSWHALLFAVLAIMSTAYHICDTDLLNSFGADNSVCSPSVEQLLARAYQTWVSFCSLQMAFLILGPEDPRFYVCEEAASHGPRCDRNAPIDVIVITRVAPLALLGISYSRSHADHDDMQWKGMVLMQLLLFFGFVGFWGARPRSAHHVLLRFNYWQRLLSYGSLPVMMRLWVGCIAAFPENRALHCIWQILTAFSSLATVRAVLPDVAGPRSTLVNMFDTSSSNPNILHMLLCGPAFAIMPTSLLGASYDWCYGGGLLISSLRSTLGCELGSYFMAVSAVPVLWASIAVFYLIDITASTKVPWTEFTRPFDVGDPRLDRERQILGKHFGCIMGCVSGGLGLAAILFMRGSTFEILLSTLFGVAAIFGLICAMILTVTYSCPASRGFELRRKFTFFVCLPLLVLTFLLSFMEHCIVTRVALPHYVVVISEQVTMLAIAFWPMTWARDFDEKGRREQSSAYAWPKTAWRFDAGLQLDPVKSGR
eukprot:TRINITY_DN7700_c0_g3_i4.p1 TRINITY_DN7700_c0_g3~~TRINITY_DN7700_c0_g3_i4.p1  ORF type:complete len:534 (-),score=71.60 TRINITY_DN7700_c0_g3_i4:435-2036(-)